MIGSLRATEVTRNELMNTYHPHIHILLFVSPTYLKGMATIIFLKMNGQTFVKNQQN